MSRPVYKYSFQIFNCERGAVMVSNAVVSSLFVVILVLFGETVSTCYQYISLQHALNEGLRKGMLRNKDPKYTEDDQKSYRESSAGEEVKNVASRLLVNNLSGSKSPYVAGSNITTTAVVDLSDPSRPAKNKWINIRIQKQLDYSSIMSLISKNAGNRGFVFDFVGSAKIKTE